ncbi:uncharacterized protein BO95DRAFT_273763 [Aspergillus brunneoviolaceus CBS 621.78]|uniref:Uncharacterized protein n=1 Tax=Aspergillus brunneoviolaceus CBS 621.78 TaxID=1450534 RepID=A0ACD1FWJ2_9EURO|nr:hypothetical protein BO95DRAFT_273763 [Aspergillus brunneoviolaceus CBS 621.78]RAH41309.1 hypothetical protein BO95DRAFT_273763 [Aspergillus brunneoviolaceus CBS 621.78]
MQTWREDWLMICREARRYLGRLRTHQLSARGKDDRLIDSIAKHMQRWTHVQGLLAEQLSQVRDFVTQYQRFSETRKFTEQMQDMISELERDISGQIDKLEQTVRDLLQIEFAWVSINEAHRSTSLATSMKRLSWITVGCHLQRTYIALTSCIFAVYLSSFDFRLCEHSLCGSAEQFTHLV